VTEKILFVDDEPQLLQSIKRQLRKRFDITIAEGGEEALKALKEKGPFAVIVADMRMPGMDGVQLLERVKAGWPDTVRMMLTGNADQETAADAVNKGQVFRFLNKPCSTPILVPALALAMRHHKLITAEKELLDETLKGSVSMLSELLTLADATAFSVGPRIKPLVKKLAVALGLSPIWQYEISASLCQIGCVTVPSDILHKVHVGLELGQEEYETYSKHPEIGSRLVSKIPRLEKVSQIIALQLIHFEDLDSDLDEDVALGAQILKITIDYDLLRQQEFSHIRSMKRLKKADGHYNPDVLTILAAMSPVENEIEIRNVSFREIVPGMVAAEDVTAKNGALLVPKDQRISWAIIESLTNFNKHVGIEEPIRVRVLAHS
jgi:response regulator RpfG family c-di-GMP phosphodiesterase